MASAGNDSRDITISKIQSRIRLPSLANWGSILVVSNGCLNGSFDRLAQVREFAKPPLLIRSDGRTRWASEARQPSGGATSYRWDRLPARCRSPATDRECDQTRQNPAPCV